MSVVSLNSANKVTPLLAQGAVARTGDDSIPGNYCADKHVWTVEGTPIVTTRASVNELSTKTEAQVERDDTVPTSWLLEMQTKTKAELERDDQVSPLGLLELRTKTANRPERDDQ